jgi:hypothetical protein
MPWIDIRLHRRDLRKNESGSPKPGPPQSASITFLDRTNSNPGWTLTGVELLSPLGQGFREAFSALQMDAPDIRTFVDFATLSLLLERHKTSGILSELPNHVLLDTTLCVLHRVLSLSRDGQQENPTCSNLPYTSQACRLAVLLYSFRHLFPLPRSAFPFLTMVRDLGESIARASVLEENDSVQRALFWCAMIGGKATVGVPENASFIALLRKISTPWGIHNEEAALPILQTFAWPDSSHDPGFWSPPAS